MSRRFGQHTPEELEEARDIATDAFAWPSDSDCAENDQLSRVCEKLEEVMDERDAVAAHLERLFETFNRIAIEGEDGMYSPRELEDALCAIFSDAPATSLARREWLRKAKQEAGYEDAVSFDVVWAETLAKAQAHDKLDREIAQHDIDRSAERVARMKAERERDELRRKSKERDDE